MESGSGAHDPGGLPCLMRWWVCWDGGYFPVLSACLAGDCTPPTLAPPGSLGSRAARELHAQATKAAFHDSVPSSNALNLPPRGALVPSAALDPRRGRYSAALEPEKQRPREGWGRREDRGVWPGRGAGAHSQS